MNKKLRGILSAVIAIVLICLCIPFTANAEGSTATKITSKDALTSGKYVIVCSNNYAMTVMSESPYWINTVEAKVNGNTLSSFTSDMVWTITVKGNSVILTDSNGVTIAPKGGNNNGVKGAGYEWTVGFNNGAFTFSGIGEDTVRLACNTNTGNNGGFNRFRGYKNTTAGGANFPDTFTLYKISDSSSTPDTEAPVTGAPETNAPTVGPTEVSLSEAVKLDDGTEVIVSGIVTDIGTPWNENFGNISVTITDNDGNSLYLYRLATKVELGDIITVTGKMATYNASRQIAAGATAKITGKAEIDEPEYVEVSIPEASKLDDGEYVTVRGTVKEINTEWSDQYENITVTIEDGNGNTLYVYRLATNVKVGDKLIITGKIGSHNGQKQIAAGATAVIDTEKAPETNAPETNTPETNAPETNAPETNAPDTNAPDTNAPDTNTPETESTDPGSTNPESTKSESNTPVTNAPIANVTEADPAVGDIVIIVVAIVAVVVVAVFGIIAVTKKNK